MRKAAAYKEWINAHEVTRMIRKSATTANRSIKIMISPLVSKVKLIHLAHFAGYHDSRRGIGNDCICKGIRGKSQTRKPTPRKTKATERDDDVDADGYMPFLGLART